MKKILRTFFKVGKFLLILYGGLAGLLIAALVAHAAVDKLTGKAMYSRAQSIWAAINGSMPAPTAIPQAEAPQDKSGDLAGESKTTEGQRPQESRDAGRIALDLRRELVKTAQDIKLWDGRVDMLSKDVKEGLKKIAQEGEALNLQREAWKEIRGAMVPVINQLLASRPGWKSISEEQFEAMVVNRDQADTAKADIPMKFSELVGELSKLKEKGEEKADREERFRALQNLPPEVLAAMLTGPSGEGGTAGDNAAADPASSIGPNQEIRFLMALDDAKRGKIFKLIQEENPGKASTLFQQILAQGGKAEAKQ